MATKERTFPSPFSVETPEGAEGWEELYPYYMRFREDDRELEESRFWFFDGMHNPSPIYPFDTIMIENWWVACNQQTTRVLVRSRRRSASTSGSSTATSTAAPTAITDPDVIAAARRGLRAARRLLTSRTGTRSTPSGSRRPRTASRV